jgi:hypothetical protein
MRGYAARSIKKETVKSNFFIEVVLLELEFTKIVSMNLLIQFLGLIGCFHPRH